MYARFREWKHCKKTNELVFCLFLTFRLTNKVKDLSHNLTKKFALQEFTSFSTTKCRYQQANIFENIQFYEVLGLIFFYYLSLMGIPGISQRLWKNCSA